MTYEEQEPVLEAALCQLVAIYDKVDCDSRHLESAVWAESNRRVAQALIDLANCPNALDRFAGALRRHSRWRSCEHREVVSIVGLAISVEIGRYNGQGGFPRHSLVELYRSWTAAKVAKPWRAATAIAMMVGPHGQAKMGSHPRTVPAEVDSFPADVFGASDLANTRRLPHVELLATKVAEFATTCLPRKQKDAVVSQMARGTVTSPENFRHGILALTMRMLDEIVGLDAEMETTFKTILGGRKAEIAKVTSASAERAKRLLAQLPRRRVRAYLTLVPSTLSAAWLRNAMAAGLIVSPVVASATMMC